MKNKLHTHEAVASYLMTELMKMGYHLVCHHSVKSADSWYIKIRVGTWLQPETVELRISDHDLPSKYPQDHINFDICCSHLREGAITCIDFLFLFATLFGKRIPGKVMELLPGTREYNAYIDSLRYRMRGRL